MPYHIDADQVMLNDLRRRIEATDLVPSRVCLAERIAEKFKALKTKGIDSLAQLRAELRSSKRLASLADATGIDSQYLVLLRREIEGYFPKPAALTVFDWLPTAEIAKLAANEIADTASLYETASCAKRRAALAKSTGVERATLDMLASLADLMRVQWVSATFARVLIAAGYDGARKVAAANADELCEALSSINAEGRYFKGKIGLRDAKRLVRAAGYVSA